MKPRSTYTEITSHVDGYETEGGDPRVYILKRNNLESEWCIILNEDGKELISFKFNDLCGAVEQLSQLKGTLDV